MAMAEHVDGADWTSGLGLLRSCSPVRYGLDSSLADSWSTIIKAVVACKSLRVVQHWPSSAKLCFLRSAGSSSYWWDQGLHTAAFKRRECTMCLLSSDSQHFRCSTKSYEEFREQTRQAEHLLPTRSLRPFLVDSQCYDCHRSQHLQLRLLRLPPLVINHCHLILLRPTSRRDSTHLDLHLRDQEQPRTTLKAPLS